MKVTFENTTRQTLAALLDLPKNQPVRAYAIFAHCFTCSKNLNAVRNISKALTQEGFGVLRFDFTGLGDSEGLFEDTNFSSNVDDLKSAYDFLETNYKIPQLLIGHSLGGAAVLFAAQQLTHIEAIAIVGAPFGPDHVKHLFSRNLKEIDEQGEAQVSIGGRPFNVKKQFVDDIINSDIAKILKNLRKALLILHSPQDQVVEIENAAKIYQHAHHPKSFISLDHADHLLSDKKDSLYVGQVISAWASRYTKLHNLNAQDNSPKVKLDVTVVLEGDHFKTDIFTHNHHLVADEPTSLGGTDLGPAPTQLLLSALGTCTAMTLRMYLNRKKWPVDKIIVHLESEKRDQLNIIYRNLEISGNLDETQRQRLEEIADKCPVHKFITSEVKVINKPLV